MSGVDGPFCNAHLTKLILQEDAKSSFKLGESYREKASLGIVPLDFSVPTKLSKPI